MTVAKITAKGQITIPKEVRTRMGVQPGDELDFVEEEEGYLIKKKITRSPFDKYIGYLKHKEGQDPDAIVEELRGR